LLDFLPRDLDARVVSTDQLDWSSAVVEVGARNVVEHEARSVT
jgi:hypothetical protein